MSSYNLMDGLRPLKRYFSHIPIPSVQEDKDEDTVISDWGIESNDFRSFSTPTLVNPESSYEGEESIGGITPRLVSNYTDLEYISHQQPKNNLKSELILKSIQQLVICRFERLRLEELAFADELKYVLITSQLLDETILISKYYQNKKASQLQLNRHKALIVNQHARFWKLNTLYTMDPDPAYNNLIVTSFLFLKYLAKNYYKYTPVQLKAFIIIVCLSLIKSCSSKRYKLKIIQSSIMNNTKKMIKKLQKLDVLVTRLINKYKELKLYPHISAKLSSMSSQKLANDIYDYVSSILTLIINSVVSNQSIILAYINDGVELENYCGIYNIEISELNFILQEHLLSLNSDDPVGQLFAKFKNYQYLRRFFICCLLSMNNPASEASQFLTRVKRIYQLPIPESNSFDFLSRWQTVVTNISTFDQLLESLIMSSTSFIKLQNISTSSNSINITSTPNLVSPNDLLTKLKELHLQLSTLNSDQSLDDQISDFSKVAPLFEQLQQLYSKELTNLTKKQRPFSVSSLHVDKRKRFSLPAQHSKISPSQRSISLTSPTVSPKNYKRLSTGLAVPLLTVLEDSSDPKRHVSYDDNYVNITPNGLASPVNITERNDDYEERDYIGERNLLSNDDSVIITNHGQEEEEEEEEFVDEEEFKRKLESNFNKLLGTCSHIERKTMTTTQEINHNNQQVGIEALPLMEELKTALSHK